MRGPPYRSPIDASGLGINGNCLRNGISGKLLGLDPLRWGNLPITRVNGQLI